MKLLKMILTDFKGVRSATYEFADRTAISGINGSGKSTIATAWYWLWMDKDSELNGNPPIRPSDDRECIPRVELVIEVAGKTVTAVKQQKMSKSKPDANGQQKITLKNEYELNAVPKTERDFKADIEGMGVDFDKFIFFSHPDAYLNQKQSDMRDMLFSMASEKSDYDIASTDDSMADLSILLREYKYAEVEAMNKASIKKANEQLDGIPNQIIGLEKAKVDIDVAELELQKNDYKRQITGIELKEADLSKQYEEYQKASDRILELKAEINGLKRTANEELIDERRRLENDIACTDRSIRDCDRLVSTWKQDVERLKKSVRDGEDYIKIKQEEWRRIKAETFEAHKAICPTCKRSLPEDEVDRLADDFESNKKKRLELVANQGTDLRNKINSEKAETEKLDLSLLETEQRKKNLDGEIIKLKKELNALPKEVDISETPEYLTITDELMKKESFLSSQMSAVGVRDILRADRLELVDKLEAVNIEIAKSQNNIRIDEQITELQSRLLDYEQAKADAERILHQLSLLSKKKNDLLVEDINSHFSVVKWKLWELYKNGEYKEVCIPTVDGYEFGRSTNTGREIIAKIDICNSLQKFFGVNLPVFLDGAESINDFNIPGVACQLITLVVTDDKELKIT